MLPEKVGIQFNAASSTSRDLYAAIGHVEQADKAFKGHNRSQRIEQYKVSL
jgi:hypothetical protein